MFMQSNGGLTDATRFQGKDAILSGPAGGVVGMVRTARDAGFERLIGLTWAARQPTSATMRANTNVPSKPRWLA